MRECHPWLQQDMMDMTVDEVVKVTITEATRYADTHPESIIHQALRIRSGVFMLATTLSTYGNEKLDVGKIHDNTPSYFDVPLPPLLEYQIDTAAIMVLKELQKHLLIKLKKLVFSNSHTKVWYEVFLVTFVLLSAVEYVYAKQQTYLDWHKNTVCSLSNCILGTAINDHVIDTRVACYQH